MKTFDSELVAIKDIFPNPYRQMATYGLIKSKVDELQASIHDTGFWPNVIGRRNPEGQVEIAYGHHRLQAATQEFGPDHTLPIHIQNIDDHGMLMIMAAENSDDWANPQQHVRMCVSSAVTELEAALDTGKEWCDLENKAAKEAFLTANNFREANEVGPSPTDVARYLGAAWTSTGGRNREAVAGRRVRAAWGLLNKTARMKSGLVRRIEEAGRRSSLQYQRSKATSNKVTAANAKAVAIKEERKAQKMKTDLDHDAKWDDKIVDKFANPQNAKAFKDGMLESDSGQEFLEKTGGDWNKALEVVEKVTGEKQGILLSTDKAGHINDGRMKIKTEAAMTVAVDATLDKFAEDRKEAYELITILDRARTATRQAASSVNRCAVYINRNGLHDQAGFNFRLVLGEIAALQTAADRLVKAADNINLEAVLPGNVYENETNGEDV
jgi:hypothetical protein